MTNYHTHTLFCDGRADMETFVRFALGRGYHSLGFSSHAPIPLHTAWNMEWDRMDDYFSTFRELKKAFSGYIELYLGLEIDYFDEYSNPSSLCYRELPLDYRIGSVHLLPDDNGNIIDADTTPDNFRRLVDEHYHGDLNRILRLYYSHSLDMVRRGGFDIVGHADKIHYDASCYRHGLLEEKWYDHMVRDYFVEIARKGYQMEVNTKHYMEYGCFYPAERYFPFLFDLGIKVHVNSDAHYPDLLDNGRMAALKALRRAGYHTVTRLSKGVWEDVPISI